MSLIKTFENFKDNKSKKNSQYWTKVVKPEVLETLDDAGIKGEARKAILSFEKKIISLKNMYYRGVAPSTVTSSKTAEQVRDLLDQLNNQGVGWDKKENEPKYWEEWVKYRDSYNKLFLKQGSVIYMSNLLDHLA